MAGLQSGSSFKATVSVSGANVSATFHTADSQRQQSGQRPQTARPTPAPAVHQISNQPVMQPRPTTAAPHPAAAAPPCKFFAAGFCKFGAACKFSHSVAQLPKAPQSARERVVPPPVIPSPALAFAPAASSPAQPPPHRQRPSLAAAPEANVAAPVVVAGPRAAATIQASQSDVLCRMVDLALSSGCMSFSASVGSGQATFIRR